MTTTIVSNVTIARQQSRIHRIWKYPVPLEISKFRPLETLIQREEIDLSCQDIRRQT
jgi:hypothetical protein